MATPVSTAVLKAVPLFSSFPEDQLRMLATVVTRKSAPRSTIVMAGGDATDSLYIVLLGRLNATHLVDIGIGVTLSSGAPYTESLGQDLFNNGRGSARPAGVGRNTLQGAGSANVDFRLSRDIKFHDAKQMTIGLDMFNALNRVNFINYQGTVASQFFGQPLGASAPRQLQLSARVKF